MVRVGDEVKAECLNEAPDEVEEFKALNIC